ncbi:MAG: FliA/WhiG family RNA polymerase sigma factor [Synergistetes bacterium]|nr:FliA/WhiG family RNA polymerase sigma factor [Synergistota bacterium]MDK2871619.1 polymerase sigma factor FliA [bacterium]
MIGLNEADAKLWREYISTKDPKVKEKLIQRYVPLVKYIVSRMGVAFPRGFDEDDLISVGIMGLLEAIDRFDPQRNVKFETFASLRIKGAIIDELRRIGWVPRTVHEKVKKLEEARLRLFNALGRDPTDEEIMEYLGVSQREYEKLLEDARVLVLFPLDSLLELEDEEVSIKEVISDPTQVSLGQAIEEEEMIEDLAKAISELPERERLVINLYYYEGLTLKEIGEVLGVSEARVCQLHSSAILKLRTLLKRLSFG